VRAILVHYSSDFVFDGAAERPYTETDRPNPRGVYAASKLLGEWFAEDAPRTYLLRVESLFGRAPGAGPEKGSAAAIIEALRSGAAARVFEDRTVSPTYVIDAARATRSILERGLTPGLYHCVNSGHCTWLEFAREAARLMNLADPRLQPIRLADLKLKALRPLYSALSNDKLTSAGVAMPEWRDGLRRHLRSTRR
jgi:dTDP-4-dehydrorhamnose reductase